MYPNNILLILINFQVGKGPRKLCPESKKMAGMEENAMLIGKDKRKLGPGSQWGKEWKQMGRVLTWESWG